MKESLEQIKNVMEFGKLKWFYIICSLYVMFLCYRNSIKLGEYFCAAIYIMIILGVCILIEITYDDRLIPRIKSAYNFLTSVIMLFIYSLIYNYLSTYLYESYVDITGVRNPLFVSGSFLSNSLIFLTTIILMYFCFSIYIFSCSLILNFIIRDKDFNIMRLFNLVIFFISVSGSAVFVFEKYRSDKAINSVVIYFLYNYQYYNNYISEDIYICKNLDIESINVDRLNLNRSEIKDVKVYPLFSEDKVSYVVKSEDSHKKISYKFDISECQIN